MSQASDRFSYAMFRQRGKLLVPPLLLALLIRYHETESDWVVFGLGGAIFAVGLALRVWAQTHLHFRLRTGMSLTVTGPYSHVRNPVYIGNVFMASGVCVGCELLWMVPLVLLWLAALYTFVVRYEEAALRERYGEGYEAYRDRVPRWFPRLRRSDPAATLWASSFLGPSLRVECLTLLWWLPVVLKELWPGR